MNLRLCVILLILLCFSGCFRVRFTVKLNEDGSGQVIEEVVFLEKLVDIAQRLDGVPTIDELTSEANVRQRMANMGKGVSLLKRTVEKQPDGSIRMVVTYAFEDISELRLAPIPYAKDWEDARLEFNLVASPTLTQQYQLDIRLPSFKSQGEAAPAHQPLSELEAQQIRSLLPIVKDMLEGFELQLRLEVYEPEKWASTTKGHQPDGYQNALSLAGGRLTVYHLTDKHLAASDDGLMMIVPWRHIGREFDLYHRGYPPGAQIMPHVNHFDRRRGGFMFQWRALQRPQGREYF
jgi:hypothetical protein